LGKKKFFDEEADPEDPGIFWILDGKNLDPGSGINILDPQHSLKTLYVLKIV
jgi:hypothetical protein